MCMCVCCFYLHVKVLLKALVYMILWSNYNIVDVVNVIMFNLIIISDATNQFLPGDNRGLLNRIELQFPPHLFVLGEYQWHAP